LILNQLRCLVILGCSTN